LFESHGANLDTNLESMEIAMNELGLYPKDAGATNINENNETITNSCFYLSLSASYLHGIGALSEECYEVNLEKKSFRSSKNGDEELSADEALIGETALDLKRTIETAVVSAHPEWAEQGVVGEEVQAFSDFLVYALDDTQTILSDWAVVVFDSVSGFVDVYKGKNYLEETKKYPADEWAKSNTISLKYLSGHYQPLFPYSQELRPTLLTLLKCLDKNGVLYTITDGCSTDDDDKNANTTFQLYPANTTQSSSSGNNTKMGQQVNNTRLKTTTNTVVNSNNNNNVAKKIVTHIPNTKVFFSDRDDEQSV